MILYIDNPIEEYFHKLEDSREKVVKIACPFITSYGARKFIDRYRNKKTSFLVLTNLSETNQLLSFTNPIKPLRELLEALCERVVIKNNSSLHAKLYLLDTKSALLGSSNMTKGGMQMNEELNIALFNNKKDDKEQILNLDVWFDALWKSSGDPISRLRLNSLEKWWELSNGLVKSLMKRLIPEPRLGGEGKYWQKVKRLIRRNKWSVSEIKKDLFPINPSARLNFLMNLGIIEYDGKYVSNIDKSITNKSMYKLLNNCFPVTLESILALVNKKPGSRYPELYKNLGLSQDKGDVPILWLESLGYLKSRTKSRRKCFYITPAGKELL